VGRLELMRRKAIGIARFFLAGPGGQEFKLLRCQLVCSILLPASCREYLLLGSREEVFRSAEARPLAAD
jgi:hypothetical protein